MKRTALVLGGKTGLVGQALCEVLAKNGWQVVASTRQDVDFAAQGVETALANLVERTEPGCVFNTVGYTAVDKAEDCQEEASLLNVQVPALLARVLRRFPCRLVHYSTDFAFNGKKNTPYTVEDATAPLSVYGKTKLAGEQALLQAGLNGCCVVRTAWLFGPGKGNFVRTILEKCKANAELKVVHDQIGSPTYTVDLATHSMQLVEAKAEGLFHVVNSGEASWCELADEAVQLAGLPCTVQPVPSSVYPQKAVRPAYSVLNTSAFTALTGVAPRPWPQALRDYVYREFLTK